MRGCTAYSSIIDLSTDLAVRKFRSMDIDVHFLIVEQFQFLIRQIHPYAARRQTVECDGFDDRP